MCNHGGDNDRKVNFLIEIFHITFADISYEWCVNHIYYCNDNVQITADENTYVFITNLYGFLYDILEDPTIVFAIYWVNLSYDILGEVYDILGEFATYWERFATYWEIMTYWGCTTLT